MLRNRPAAGRRRRPRIASRTALRFEAIECRRLLTSVADLDVDGDLDVVGPSGWFENYDGQGNFEIRRLTSSTVENIVAGDIDGDGDLDLVTNEPKWYENRDGRGDFGIGQALPGADGMSSLFVYLTDTASDGVLDVVLYSPDEFLHYDHRDGQLMLAERIDRPPRAMAADIDGDGDLDVTYVDEEGEGYSATARVWLRRNNGNQEFQDELLISERAGPMDTVPTHTFMQDIDMDGWTDLLVHREEPSFPTFLWSWYRNVEGEIAVDGGRSIVSTYMANIIGIFDVDGDGDPDGVAEEPVSTGERIIWTENDGNGQFATPELLCECGLRPVAGGDVNGDQLPDLVLDGLVDGVPVWVDGVTGERHENVVASRELIAGDANADFRFDQADLIVAAQAAKFATGQPASWSEGDWNGAPGGSPQSPPTGDGRFDQRDLDAALATGRYRLGQYRPTSDPPIDQLEPPGIERARRDVVVTYNWSTGEVTLSTSNGALTSMHLVSQQGRFSQPQTAFAGPFDVATATDLFQLDFSGELIMDLGAILPRELPWESLLDDLRINGSRLGGGGLGPVRLDCLGCAVDINALQTAILSESTDLRFDLDRNHRVDADDVGRLINELLDTEYGDANLDGQFTTQDLVDVFRIGEYEDGIAGNSTWSDGDWDTDGEFTSHDLVFALQAGGYELMTPLVLPRSKILATSNPHDVLKALIAADMDGDGDWDLVVGAYSSQGIGEGSRIDWYENTDGLGSMGAAKPVTHELARVSSAHVADFDGDGDLDVVASSIDDDTIAWFANVDGQGNFGPPEIISTSADFALSVFADDLDGDGDLDVLSTSLFDHRIVWYENTDGAGSFGSPRPIRTGNRGDYEYRVQTGDIDGDGDVDVVSANGNSVSWSENEDGGGSFESPNVIAQLEDLLIVHVADLDGDGDLDVATGDVSTQRVSWFENLDGRGTFGHERVLTNEAYDVRSIAAADLDNDGDLDLMSNTFYGQLAWYENLDGNGRFAARRLLTQRSFSGMLATVDFDLDGDIDVLAPDDSDVWWFENGTVVPPE
jgi:hypothetical protein